MELLDRNHRIDAGPGGRPFSLVPLGKRSAAGLLVYPSGARL